MDKLYIVANLKSHMNKDEANAWINSFLQYKDEVQKFEEKEIIISPSFTLLQLFSLMLSGTSFKLAAQNLSPFDEGAYTGEINAKQIKDFAQYVIIGHSERRTNFNETDQLLSNKVQLATKYGLRPIYCIQDKNNTVPQGVSMIAYEPIFAIGSGSPDTPENAQKVREQYHINNDDFSFLYGGSVTSKNVSSFTKNAKINGVLVGGASLDPLEFISIIKNA